jgi:hypothetical protein
MRVVENTHYSRRTAAAARLNRALRNSIANVASWFLSAWSQAFPMPSPDDPSTPPNIAKAAVLREAAKLSENVDAESKRYAS